MNKLFILLIDKKSLNEFIIHVMYRKQTCVYLCISVYKYLELFRWKLFMSLSYLIANTVDFTKHLNNKHRLTLLFTCNHNAEYILINISIFKTICNQNMSITFAICI